MFFFLAKFNFLKKKNVALENWGKIGKFVERAGHENEYQIIGKARNPIRISGRV